ncbi:MAG: UDP-2,3-diacylglucosamine diphosphatase LpxI [Planctomycetaceae bacterium]|nr:UDP-2,3-diacylglucosamine diphosphatase LpxI [Planctomycetaceae bacterium]
MDIDLKREPVGLIAGSGRLPFLVANGIIATGRPLITIGFSSLASVRLKGLSDDFKWVGIVRAGQWIRFFKKHGVHEAVMVGGVKKQAIYTPLRLLRYVPDIRSAKIWYLRLRKDKRDNAVLLSVADELRSEGIELVSSVKYCQEHLADEGLMTHKPLPGGVAADVDFGWYIARASADLDIGQSIAVKERDIIAVEAMEGTDAMIRRAGRVCRKGKWIMVKVARPKQDMRFDVPTVGPSTIRNLKDAKCACLVVEAGKTLIVDKPATLALADKLGIAVVGKGVAPTSQKTTTCRPD